MYAYEAIIIEVIDGDTVKADVDLGFGIWIQKLHLRLAGIDAPELHGPQRELALKAKARVEELCMLRTVKIDTSKGTEKYGRWLARIDAEGVIVNDVLVSEGLAKPYDGGKR